MKIVNILVYLMKESGEKTFMLTLLTCFMSFLMGSFQLYFVYAYDAVHPSLNRNYTSEVAILSQA